MHKMKYTIIHKVLDTLLLFSPPGDGLMNVCEKTY